MSNQELKKQENLLSQALKESYEKMLQLKMKLGQKVVIGDISGKPIVMSAEQAWQKYIQSKSSDFKD